MKNILVKLLKILLVVVLVLLVVLLVFGLVLRMDWPWWLGLVFLAILAGIGVGALFLRRIMLRRREQRFVQQVIEQDEARLKVFSGKERDEMKGLQDRWKEAVDALRRSHLRRQGNPLYVLPWYLVMGESGSGKTTALGSAKLSSPFVEVTRTSGISGTKNCDWWFFEQAVVIDTAGRYAIPVDEGRDKEEWQRFLTLLVKYRKKEPLNGLIVTVAADKLLEAPPHVLEEDGRSIRRRIDELMRVLGVKFPVYLLVTKCDLIQGMARFAEQLPEKGLDQPMGYVNQNLSKDIPSFMESVMNTIGERLRTLRLLILHRPQSKTADPALLLFPEEFEHLKRGLVPFVKSAFQENPYQETPILRGLFFSSGRQEGTPYSHFLEALGLISEREVLPGTSKGLFLHEFFAKVLPTDRKLFAPTTRAIEWRALTRNLGLTAWVLIAVALCGLLSFSFVKNLKAIREVSGEFARPPVLKGEFIADINTMDRFRQAVLSLEVENRNWWVPRFGLNESISVETVLKGQYCKRFHEGFLASFDRYMADVMPKLVAGSASDEVLGQYVVHLVRRINLLRGRQEGLTFDKLKEKPQPAYVSLISGEQGAGNEIRKRFGNLYLYYLIWRTDTGEMNKETAILQAWLKELLITRGANFQWLIVWVNKESGLTPVTLGEFWGGSLTLPDERSIGPAFTRKGKETIDSFLKEVDAAVADPAILESQKTAFHKGYRNTCFDTWQGFAAAFPKGSGRLKGAKEWQQLAPRMATDQSPYFTFLNKVALELEPVSAGEGTPLWMQQIYQLQLAKAQGYAKAAAGKVGEEGRRIVGAIEKMLGKEIQGTDVLEAQIAAGKAYQDLTGSLTSISSVVTSRNQAYQLASQVFGEDPGTGKSPFYAGYGAASRLKTGIGRGKAAEDTVSRLITGPLDFLWTYTRMETACYLQKQWEEKVLVEAQGVTGPRAVQILAGPEGPVWKFVKGTGTAAPFLGWGPGRGYYTREALGGGIPFDGALYGFLAKGAKVTAAASAKESYNVTIRGLPTDANPDARLKPHGTRLELYCSAGAQSLVNQNYPASKTFMWSPDTCTDVLFQIEVGDLLLTKKYSGPRAFPDFLQEFRAGRRTFSPEEFPAEKNVLDRMGIKYIRVNYQLSGDRPVVGTVASLPAAVPGRIARCWE